jgi:hypothetical protein
MLAERVFRMYQLASLVIYLRCVCVIRERTLDLDKQIKAILHIIVNKRL